MVMYGFVYVYVYKNVYMHAMPEYTYMHSIFPLPQ
jgi:hypothetical protein